MAPKPVHPSVQSQLLGLLIASRAAGKSFEDAWADALPREKIWMCNHEGRSADRCALAVR